MTNNKVCRFYTLHISAPNIEFVDKVIIPKIEATLVNDGSRIRVHHRSELYANFNILCWNCGEATRRNEEVTMISDQPKRYYCSKLPCKEAFRLALALTNAQ